MMRPLLLLGAAAGGAFILINTACGSPFALSDVVNFDGGGTSVNMGLTNGNGLPDLVSVNLNIPGLLSVATNAGNGIFYSNASYSVGQQPFSVAVADINGDGRQDLVSANLGDNTITVLTNSGTGLFGSNATYAAGNGPYFVLATDINGDGKPDVITANEGDGTLSVLTNAGAVLIPAHAVQVVNPQSAVVTFAVADLNGDGRPDLIAGDANDGLIEVLTNAGAGNFVSNAVYVAGSKGTGPFSILAGDFNNDRKMDIACASYDGTVTVFTNAGNGILARSETFTVPGSGYQTLDFTAADVDGDGNVDLLVDGYTSGGVYVLNTLFNRGSGGLFITNYINLTDSINTVHPQVNWITAGDINSDGKPDVAGVGSSGTFSACFVMTNGIGSFPNAININVFTNTADPPVTNITAQATSASGAVVYFTTVATNWTGSWMVTNEPPSGSIFPLGTTAVASTTSYFIKSNIYGQTNITFTVTVQDTNAPVITLLGAVRMTNYVDNYVDPGATATDPIYGNLTGSIIVSGDLNVNLPGTYTVTYSVTDPSGNSATANRTVVLLPLPPLGVGSFPGNQTALFYSKAFETNFVLQMTTNLAGGNWANVSNATPGICVFVTNSAPATFFRLQPK